MSPTTTIPFDEKTIRQGTGSLTVQQIDRYDSDGYIVLPGLLDDADIAPARQAMSEKVDEIAADLLASGLITDKLEGAPFETRLARIFAGLSDMDFLKYGRGWRDRRAGYYELMANSKILDAVESLIGPEIFSNPVYNVRPKVPGVAAGAVPWHQDKSYWPGSNSNPVITVWIPLVESNEANGCLHIWPGTLKTDVLSYHAETYSSTGYTEIDFEHTADAQAVPLPISAGTAILFNDRCIHMSTPNKADSVRWSVDLRYQPTDQDPMIEHGIGFLARSSNYPDRIATIDDWLAYRPEHSE